MGECRGQALCRGRGGVPPPRAFRAGGREEQRSSSRVAQRPLRGEDEDGRTLFRGSLAGSQPTTSAALLSSPSNPQNTPTNRSPAMTTETDEHAMAPRLYETAVAQHPQRLLAAVSPDQWDAPTPCTEWDVRHLVTHLVTTSMNAKSIMDGNGPQQFGDDVLGDDPLAAFDAAVAATAAAFSVPGAMERTVATRRGDQVAGRIRARASARSPRTWMGPREGDRPGHRAARRRRRRRVRPCDAEPRPHPRHRRLRRSRGPRLRRRRHASEVPQHPRSRAVGNRSPSGPKSH